MSLDKRILLARFQLNPDALANYTIAVLEFPYSDAVSGFREAIKEIRSDKFSWPERAPYRQLNNALIASAPMLIQGFEEAGKSRRMIAFANCNGVEMWRPSTTQIMRLVRDWASLWVQSVFAEEIKTRPGRDASREFLDLITKTQVADWEKHNALDLWNDLDDERRIAWSAIPSVLSVMLVAGQQTIELKDRDGETRSFKWQLTQGDGNRLAAVSEVLTANNGGRYAYLADFGIQTQATNPPDPWIFLNLSVRRYMSQPVRSVKNPKHGTSIMVRLRSPRIEGWGFDSTLVRLTATGKPKEADWDDKLQELLRESQARLLEPVTEIYKTPDSYSISNPELDSYHVVYSEGMTPKHSVKQGLSLQERSDLVASIVKQMQGIIIEDTPQLADEKSVLKLGPGQKGIPSIRQMKILAMFTNDDLKALSSISPETKLDITVAALRQAAGKGPVQILILYRAIASKGPLEKYVRQTLFSDESQPLPSDITITCLPVYGNLGTAPGKDLPDTPPWHPSYKERQKLRKKWNDDIRVAYEKKVGEWKEFLAEINNSSAHTLALIEMDGNINSATVHDEWFKSALRRACVSQGINSQMIFSVDRAEQGYPASVEPISRIKRAACDLLLRQTPVMYGQPADIYRYAGLPDDIARNLTVLGLFRYRSNRLSVDYPLAVALLPDGKVLVDLPSENGIPLGNSALYLDSAIKLGMWFIKDTGDKTHIDLRQWADKKKSYKSFNTFVSDIICNVYTHGPTLLLLEADGWRTNILPALKNEGLSNGRLDLSTNKFEPSQLPHLRVIRVRDAGQLGETPQYVPTSHEQWENIDDADDLEYMVGLEDRTAKSRILHYYSIGGCPRNAQGQDNETFNFSEGAEIAHKHQQAIELVPFFMQPGDDRLAWCRVAHFLRSSPAWEIGNTTLPYPLHLAKTLVDDQLDVLAPWR